MRKPIIAGNWKMHKNKTESVVLASEIAKELGTWTQADIVLCPTFTNLDAVNQALVGSSIGLGAQNMHTESLGAYTGEISSTMLTSIGCNYVIIGHSERRQLFGETHSFINKKVIAALHAGLTPILCVGETLAERESNTTFSVISTQLKEGLASLTSAFLGPLVIAYEPVWAIGTGKVATPQEAQAVHAYIRQELAVLLGPHLADKIRIQYGGSVKPDNIQTLMQEPDIDGALVGGASLEASSFIPLVKNASPQPVELVRQTLF